MGTLRTGIVHEQPVSLSVMPYLFYFSELGLTPKIVGCGTGIVYFEHISSPHFATEMNRLTRSEERVPMVQALGRTAAIFSKYGVSHLDFHHYNVLRSDKPLTIDWITASRCPHFDRTDLDYMSWRILQEHPARNGAPNWGQIMADAFDAELATPLTRSESEIEDLFNARKMTETLPWKP